MPEFPSIEHLSTSTRNKLRSTQILTSLPQIVSELLQNSLDAGARQVEIGVDCEEWSCWVRDDGVGISKEGLSVLEKGSNEGRYETSKAYDPASLDTITSFGFRGEALASAADLSCLEISSRTSRSRESWSVILKGGKNLYDGPSLRWRREQVGTVVCLRDVFYNLPIRRLSHPSPARTMELIRQDMESFALVCPSVSFSLENTSRSRESSSSKSGIMRVPKTTSSLATFRHLYGRALVEHVDEIRSTCGDMKLEGFISLNGAYSKAHQFLYINRHPLGSCDIHRIIDNKFASSSFAKHAYDETGETSLPRSTLRRSPRKTERKPVYVLNLTIPPRQVDNCLEPAKTIVQLQNHDTVLSFVSSVIESFLARHGFTSPRKLVEKVSLMNGGFNSPRKKRRIVLEDSEDCPSVGDRSCDEPDDVTFSHPPSLHVDPDGPDGHEVIWKDPNTGETFVVDQRTGNSYRQEALPSGTEEENEGSRKRRTLRSVQLPRKSEDPYGIENVTEDNSSMPNWLQEALQANTAYALTETKIPSLSLSSAFTNEMQDPRHNHHACHSNHQSTSRYFQDGHTDAELKPSLRRFRKEDLSNAHIISQVDRKFIACLLRDDSDRSIDGDQNEKGHTQALVLIDQHAADERVRVERFLKDLCLGFLHHGNNANGVTTRKLVPSVPVLLTRYEASCLAQSDTFQRAFECWGISFDSLPSTTSQDWNGGPDDTGGAGLAYVQVFVKSVPTVVGDKLLIGDELRELIKGFLAKLIEDKSAFSLAAIHMSIGEEAKNEPFFWLKALRWCPRELLDLVNSKACRGAIMFNDSLTLTRCQRLVRQLSETAFPFQCAHGRPSLVPLANLGDGKVASGRCRASQVEWDELV